MGALIAIVVAAAAAITIALAPVVVPTVERAIAGSDVPTSFARSVADVFEGGMAESWIAYYREQATGDIALILALFAVSAAAVALATLSARAKEGRVADGGTFGRQSSERRAREVLRRCLTWDGGKLGRFGFVVGFVKGRYVVSPAVHCAVFAPSGTGKTRTSCLPTIVLAKLANTNLVITDPSRELYAQSRAMLERSGYDVALLDFEDAHAGSKYDFLAPVAAMHEQGADHLAEERCDEIGTVIFPDTGTDADSFSRPAAGLLSGVCYYVATSPDVPSESRNFSTAVRIVLEGTTGGDSAAFKGWLRGFPADGPVRSFCAPYLAASDRFETSIAGTLATGLRPFASSSLRYMASGGGLDFAEFLKRPSALFLHTVAPGMPANKAAGLAISQLWAQISRDGQRRGSIRQTVFLLDEAHSVGDSLPLVQMLELGRKFGVRACLYYQSLAGLGDEQGREAVLANCDAKVCYRAGDLATAKYFQDLSGLGTFLAKNTGESKSSRDASSSAGFSERERAVWMAGDLLQRDPEREGVALFQNPTGHRASIGKFEVPIQDVSGVPFMVDMLKTVGSREFEAEVISSEVDRLAAIAAERASADERDRWLPDFGARINDSSEADDPDVFGL